MLAQSRTDEVAAAAEQRRAADERAEFAPASEHAGYIRSARLLVSSLAHEMQRVLLTIRTPRQITHP
jgi:hypothetical protein